MATTTTITSSFVGDAASELIGDALLSGNTLKGGYLTILPDVKFKRTLPRISSGSIIQADSASWSPTGTIVNDERTITPIALKVNVEVPKATLESQWMALQMKPGALNSTYPNGIGDYVVSYFGQQIGQDIEQAIWAGDTTGATGNVALDLVEGLVKAGLKHSSGYLNVAPTTLSASNIIAELKKVYEAIPATILDKPDLKIFISTAAMRYYREATAAQNFLVYYTEQVKPYFLGIELVAAHGMPTNNMVAACSSNLFFGTDLISDMNEIHILDMSSVTGDNTLRYNARFKASVAVAWEKEVVVYGTQL